MTTSKKDHEAVAAALTDIQCVTSTRVTALDHAKYVAAVALVFKEDNPRFDSERFARAAGVTSPENVRYVLGFVGETLDG